MPNNTDKNDATTLLEAGRILALIQNVIYQPGAAPVAVRADGAPVILDYKQWEAWQPSPLAKRGQYTFGDVDSFVRYVKEHKQPGTYLTINALDPDGAAVVAVLDGHRRETASWECHQCELVLHLTKDYLSLCQNNSVPMTQQAFTEWLEDMEHLFVNPKGADLLEIISNLHGHANATIKSAVRTQSGAISLAFDEDTKLSAKGQTVEIPSLLELSVAPFERTPTVPVRARLRYRLADRALSFHYKLLALDQVVPAVLVNAAHTIHDQTGLEPYWA